MTAFAPALEARRLLRAADRAALASALPPGVPARLPLGSGWPFASLVLLTVDHAGIPLLLISDLALHSRNIGHDGRVALLIDGAAGGADPLTGPRVAVLGEADPIDDPEAKARILRRHPSAALYAEFADFRLYRVRPAAAHYVAGFGKIHWIAGSDLLFDTARSAALAAAEADIVANINDDRGDAVTRIARHLMGRKGGGWRLAGIDPEGFDLRRKGDLARFDFRSPVGDKTEARAEFARLARAAGRAARQKA
jgi:putative heme iron utilization protein